MPALLTVSSRSVVLCKRDSKTSMETITMKPLLDS
jgi:hypothetical protein